MSLPNDAARCSEASRVSGETFFATAGRADYWLLVEHSPPWGKDKLEHSDLPQEAVENLERLRVKWRVRVQFIYKPERKGVSGIRACCVRQDTHSPKCAWSTLRDYGELADLDFEEWDRSEEEPRSFAIVCTDGKYDRCCAIHGHQARRSMEELGIEVWQTSHIGADRLAGNAVMFPWGLLYGHLDSAAAVEVAKRHLVGEICLPYYRGSPNYGPFAQAAEYFIRRDFDIASIGGFSLLKEEYDSEERRVVLMQSDALGKNVSVVVEVRQSDFANYMTCTSAQKQHVPQYVLAEYIENQ